MRSLSLIVVLITSGVLFGCSQRFQDTQDTFQEAFFGRSDIEMSEQKVKDLPYASLYARVNQGPQIFMVLAFVDYIPSTQSYRLKWLSADGAMLATENGRIVKTLSLPGSNLSNLHAPNKPTLHAQQWQATFDWQPDYRFSQEAQVTTHLVGNEKVSSLLWEKNTDHIRETYKFETTKDIMTSDYWLDDLGNVVKSAQWLIPEELYVELEILKPYAANQE